MLDGIRAASQSFIGRALLAVLMAVIVFSFAIFGIGDMFRGFQAGKVAEVGSGEVTADQVRTVYQNELQRLQRRAQRAITNDEARAIGLDQQVVGRLVAETALDQFGAKLGLAMSDAAVAKIISEDSAFKDVAGRFDPLRFQDVLRDNGLTERGFVRQQRAVYLRQEIAEAVAGRITAPKPLLAAVHRFRNETRSIDYFVLPASAIGDLPAPDDKTLQTYFEDHHVAYAAPEYRRLVTLAVTPTQLATADSVSDADAMALYDRVKAERYTSAQKRQVQQIVFPSEAEAKQASGKLKSGTPFEEIVAQRKLTPTDVDLGLVKKSDIANLAIAETAFSLADGAISEPLKTQFGAALVRVTRIEPAQVQPFAEVATALKNEIARDRAKAQVRTLHDKIEDARSSGKSLTETAKAAGLEARTIDAIDALGQDRTGAAIPGLIAKAETLKAAFASDVGVDNETVTTPDDGYVWFEVAGIEPAHERTLAQARELVLAGWREEETDRRLAEKGAALVKQLSEGGDIAKVAADAGAAVKHDSAVKRGGAADLPANAIVQVFDVPNGGAGSATTPAGRLVFRVLDDVVPDFDPDSAEAKASSEQLNAALEQDLLNQFVSKIEADAGVKINGAALRAAVGGSGSEQ